MFGDVFDDNGKAIRDIQGQQANFGIRHYVETGKTATGTEQADAYELKTLITQFTTVAAGTGAILPNVGPGKEVKVKNRGANALLVYPPVGHFLDGALVNVSVSLAVGAIGTFIQVDATHWITSEAPAA